MVHNLICEHRGDVRYSFQPLDGDIDKVKPIDMSFDRGTLKLPTILTQGLKMDVTHLPTKLRCGGPKRELADVQHVYGVYLVPETFREILERLEPGVHDFYPVELVWKDGSSAGKRYWFYPQHRIDTVDREKTTFVLKPLWDSEGDESRRLVFNRKAIGDCHAWVDKLIPDSGVVLVSEKFKQELDAAGISGMRFKSFDETD